MADGRKVFKRTMPATATKIPRSTSRLCNDWGKVCRSLPDTIFLDLFIGPQLRFVIKRGGALCAYIGIPYQHPKYGTHRAAGLSQDEAPNIPCHGGVTYSDHFLPVSPIGGWWWYGWDYAHAGDAIFHPIVTLPVIHGDGTLWTPKMIWEDSQLAIRHFPCNSAVGHIGATGKQCVFCARPMSGGHIVRLNMKHEESAVVV
jgi:hypothetical protein